MDNVRKLPLTRELVAVVDQAEYGALSQWKWSAIPRSDGHGWYAARWIWRQGKRKTIYLHRQIMQAADDEQVDHVNGNGLDNRRSNLRRCDQSHNFANRKVLPVRDIPYRGVYLDKRRGTYFAAIKINGKSHRLGTFTTMEPAARAYDKAASEAFGEFASLNFPAGRA